MNETPVVYSEAFMRSLHFSLRWEGGYSDDPFDPGGATWAGITIGTLTKWWRFIKKDRTPTPHDLRNLTTKEKYRIYHTWYWETCKCDQLYPSVALVVLDCSINQGPGRARKLLQKALRVKADGIIGTMTMSALKSADERSVIRDFCALRAMHYSSLPTLARFGYGWFRRLFSSQQEALKLLQSDKRLLKPKLDRSSPRL